MFNHAFDRMTSFASLPRRDTRAWTLQVWTSFGVAVFLCATGLAWLPGQDLVIAEPRP